jgi:hypothetical protein
MEGTQGQLQSHKLTTNRFPRGMKNLASLEPPIFVYGAARHMGVSNLDKSELADPFASLFSSATELYDAEESLLNLDYLAAKSRKDRDQSRLQQVKQLLATLLPDISDEPRHENYEHTPQANDHDWLPLTHCDMVEPVQD